MMESKVGEIFLDISRSINQLHALNDSPEVCVLLDVLNDVAQRVCDLIEEDCSDD